MRDKLRPGAVVAIGVALILSIGFIVIAYVAPVVASETTTSSGTTTTTGITLIDAVGPGVLGIVAAPLVATLIVAGCLMFRDRVGWLGLLAWIAAGGLALLALAGLASVGLLILPIAVALLIAVVLSRAQGPAR